VIDFIANLKGSARVSIRAGLLPVLDVLAVQATTLAAVGLFALTFVLAFPCSTAGRARSEQAALGAIAPPSSAPTKASCGDKRRNKPDLGRAIVREAVNTEGAALGLQIVSTDQCASCAHFGFVRGDIVTHISSPRAGAPGNLIATPTHAAWRRQIAQIRHHGRAHFTVRILRDGQPVLITRALERPR